MTAAISFPWDELSCCHPAINSLEITISKALLSAQTVRRDPNNSLFLPCPLHAGSGSAQLLAQGELGACKAMRKLWVRVLLVEALCWIRGVLYFHMWVLEVDFGEFTVLTHCRAGKLRLGFILTHSTGMCWNKMHQHQIRLKALFLIQTHLNLYFINVLNDLLVYWGLFANVLMKSNCCSQCLCDVMHLWGCKLPLTGPGHFAWFYKMHRHRHLEILACSCRNGAVSGLVGKTITWHPGTYNSDNILQGYRLGERVGRWQPLLVSLFCFILFCSIILFCFILFYHFSSSIRRASTIFITLGCDIPGLDSAFVWIFIAASGHC